MKKLVLSTLAIITLMLTTQMNAQSDKGLFFSINGGYNFSSASQNLGSNSTFTTSSIATTSSTELVSGSFGKGLNFGGAIGYMFNKNIGAELGINYLIGGETKNSDITNSPNNITNDETKYSSKMLQFRPTIILTAGMDKINPYAKFGMLIGSGSFNISDNSTESSTFGNTTTTETKEKAYKYDGDLAVGFQSALGLSYNVNEKIAIFGELNLVNLSYAPSKRSLTTDTKNGVDKLPTRSIKETQTEYVDSYNTSEAIPATSSNKDLKRYFAFSSFGINFGLKYSL